MLDPKTTYDEANLVAVIKHRSRPTLDDGSRQWLAPNRDVFRRGAQDDRRRLGGRRSVSRTSIRS